jgi:4-amino-4-deoxy-L-arabinose transferase-like glycosyltransferase
MFFLLLLAIFFGYELGNRHFAHPDEGRYVEIPREMVVTGDYVTPHLNGLKYFEKPALF